MPNWRREAGRILFTLDVTPVPGSDVWGTTKATVETTVGTVTIPGGTLGPNGNLAVTTYSYNPLGVATVCKCFCYFGGMTIMSITQDTNDSLLYRSYVINRNSESGQIATAFGDPGGGGWGTAGNPVQTDAIDTTQDVDLVWTMTSDGTNPIEIPMVIVELI